MTTTTTTRLTGTEALSYCREHGIEINKYGDCVSGPEDDLSLDDKIVSECMNDDPGLLWVEVETALTATINFDGTIYVDDTSGGRWSPSNEAHAELARETDPKAAAVAMAMSEPMRGAWSC